MAKVPVESQSSFPPLRHSWKASFVSAVHLRNIGLEDV